MILSAILFLARSAGTHMGSETLVFPLPNQSELPGVTPLKLNREHQYLECNARTYVARALTRNIQFHLCN